MRRHDAAESSKCRCRNRLRSAHVPGVNGTMKSAEPPDSELREFHQAYNSLQQIRQSVMLKALPAEARRLERAIYIVRCQFPYTAPLASTTITQS